MITTKKKFELMDYKITEIPLIRKQAQEWAKLQKFEIVRIFYGICEERQKIDTITVEYKR